ncbi:MAG TPA: hypothetical protein VGL22_01060 [Terracidiphilus sp.]|jgi:hypothetical protein
MHKSVERLLLMSDSEVLGLREQAAAGVRRLPRRSQFSHLLRHFLERFFNHETASPDGDAKARMVLIACAAGLPPFIVAIYLWPVYHAFIRVAVPGNEAIVPGPPPYWVQVNHHLFFVVYSFAVTGIVTVFEWDLFFPDLLDVLVLNILPIPHPRLFFARVTAIAVLLAGFLFDANVLATVVLPAAIDPPSLAGFLAGHALAVGASGLFAAAFIVALQGVLLFVFGDRWFRKISLFVQGAILALLLLTLLLFPVYSDATAVVLGSGSNAAWWFPPFWFVGIYQCLMEGPSALPVHAQLAQLGCELTLGAIALAVLVYPLAYRRRVYQLVQGANARSGRNVIVRSLHKLLHATVLRAPVRRAVFHFIGQTLLRVPRYRIYLVLYGSVGVAIVAATVMRFAVAHGQVHLEVTAEGIRAAIGIAPLWTLAGLRVALTSSGNRQGNWIFRNVHGQPLQFATALEMFSAARIWAFAWSAIVTLTTAVAFRAIAPSELLTWQATAAQLLLAVGLCVVLADAFFLNVTTVAFSGEPQPKAPNLAFTILKYFLFFPPVVTVATVVPVWIGHSMARFALVTIAFTAAHFVLRARHHGIVKEYCRYDGPQEGEGEHHLNLLGLSRLRRG